jgi:hypothetical protein
MNPDDAIAPEISLERGFSGDIISLRLNEFAPPMFPVRSLARMPANPISRGVDVKFRIRERRHFFGLGELFMKRSNACVLVLVLLIATQSRVQAYTDPGTGTLIWQMLLAASFGVMFYLRRIVTWARKLRSRDGRADEAGAATTPEESL